MPSTPQTNLLESRLFSGLITALILYSVIGFSIETLPDLSPGMMLYLEYSETVVIVLFTLEYLYRLYTAPERIKFIFSFYGLVDLIAILPFYLAPTLDLRMLRLLQLFRLVRLLKLVRYNKAMQRFSQAIYLATEELIVFLFASMLMLYFAAVGIYHFEHAAQPEVYRSLFDCLWWAVSTLTTVGYGDIYPITLGGKLFTFVVLLTGLGLVAVPTGIIASALSSIRQPSNKAIDK